MKRIAFMVAAALAAGPAWAQSLDGSIWSHMATGLNSGFAGDIKSGFQSGFGPRDRGRHALTQDFTLGSGGALQPIFPFRGQPSNFLRSVAAMGPYQDSQLTFDGGPRTTLAPGFAAGPAGPLD